MPTKKTKEKEDSRIQTDCGPQEWFRASDDVRKGRIQGVTFAPKDVEYSVINGQAIFEGDILLGKANEIDTSTDDVIRPLGIGITGSEVEHGVGRTGQRFRWPKGVMPYEIHPDLPNQQRVTDALRHISDNTRIRFVLRTSANAATYPNYVQFFEGDGCWSQVGMQGGRQQISLAAGCGFGAAVHEVLHALGLWHEQSREDRNTQVRINWENIDPSRRHNFNQHITDGDDIGSYDFDSIMHYGPFAFSVNNQPTIEPLNGQTIGQRNGMSAGDIAAIRALYPHLEPSRTWSNVQFRADVPAGATRRWFTHSWPHHWYVLWTVVPTAPVQDGAAQLEWKVQVEKQAETLLKYYIEVKNLSPHTLAFEARYDVLGWSQQTF